MRINNNFTPCNFTSSMIKDDDLAFVFDKKNILINEKDVPLIGSMGDNFKERGLFFGNMGSKKCYAFNLNSEDKMLSIEKNNFIPLRTLLTEFDKSISDAACYSSHLLFWHNRSKYCGCCGGFTVLSQNELAKVCTKCKTIHYPKISPAVIVAVTKGNKLLLAHNKNFKNDHFSVLAGFVEIGESIEQAAVREIKEEVDIEIKNIKYFFSQAWPFQDSLMIGLTAEYKSGKINPDGEEILNAGWFKADEFPLTPGIETIAGKLIENFKKTNRS